MKFAGRTQAWIVALSAVLLAVVAKTNLFADSDEFRFAIAYAPVSEDPRILTEKKVAMIFQDKLGELPRAHQQSLAKHFLALCRKHRLDPALVLSLIQVESGFNVDATSSVGAIGLMQLMPQTAQVVASRFNIPYKGARSLRDPFTNLSIGIAYFAFLRDKYRELPPYFHIAAYNIGPAKLDQLLVRKTFKPTQTRVYFDRIRKGVPSWREYRTERERLRERRERREDRMAHAGKT